MLRTLLAALLLPLALDLYAAAEPGEEGIYRALERGMGPPREAP